MWQESQVNQTHYPSRLDIQQPEEYIQTHIWYYETKALLKDTTSTIPVHQLTKNEFGANICNTKFSKFQKMAMHVATKTVIILPHARHNKPSKKRLKPLKDI